MSINNPFIFRHLQVLPAGSVRKICVVVLGIYTQYNFTFSRREWLAKLLWLNEVVRSECKKSACITWYMYLVIKFLESRLRKEEWGYGYIYPYPHPNMAGQSRLQIAKHDIVKVFEEAGRRVFWPSEISQILEQNRAFWRLARNTTTAKFLDFLVNKTDIHLEYLDPLN